MTDRLYYTDSFLYDFEADVIEILPPSSAGSRRAVIMDRTAFYPTSGGQVFDTGWIAPLDASDEAGRARVIEVAERENGTVLHFLDSAALIRKGTRVRGLIDADRRRDHMQQHSGQHVLSAAFVRLFDLPTVSFHMGDDYCSIDLETNSLTAEQVEAAERLANEVILENRPVEIRFVTQEEARGLGLRKLPPGGKDKLRLIAIHDFDLTACGGTHVRGTGQIGCVLLRKTEKVRQGTRVEFVCGLRAVRTARRDYSTLVEAGALYSSHIWDLPQQIRKAQEEVKGVRRSREQLLEELAELYAAGMLSQAEPVNGRKVITRVFSDRDLPFIKLLAQKLTRLQPNAVALLGSRSGQPSLVFAQSEGLPFDMGALMKEALAKLGGRGGGSKDMAQGGPTDIRQMGTVLVECVRTLNSLK
jgi:alanyl-tRNA synthetase